MQVTVGRIGRPHGVRGAVGIQPRADSEPEVGLIGPDTDHDSAADPVRAADPADDDPHRGQRASLASTRSIRT